MHGRTFNAIKLGAFPVVTVWDGLRFHGQRGVMVGKIGDFADIVFPDGQECVALYRHVAMGDNSQQVGRD